MERAFVPKVSPASPGTQWIYSSVSEASLQKTGVFLNSALGEFRVFAAKCLKSLVGASA
jgi:hypothetical protein